MKRVKISIFIALFLAAFVLLGARSVLAACQGGDDGLHSDAIQGGDEGFHSDAAKGGEEGYHPG